MLDAFDGRNGYRTASTTNTGFHFLPVYASLISESRTLLPAGEQYDGIPPTTIPLYVYIYRKKRSKSIKTNRVVVLAAFAWAGISCKRDKYDQARPNSVSSCSIG